MKLKIFALYDRAVGVYARPIFAPALGAVLRDLKTAVNARSEDNLAMHSADFDLFEFGEFEDAGGVWKLLPQPELRCNCGSLKEVPQPPSDSLPE